MSAPKLDRLRPESYDVVPPDLGKVVLPEDVSFTAKGTCTLCGQTPPPKGRGPHKIVHSSHRRCKTCGIITGITSRHHHRNDTPTLLTPFPGAPAYVFAETPIKLPVDFHITQMADRPNTKVECPWCEQDMALTSLRPHLFRAHEGSKAQVIEAMAFVNACLAKARRSLQLHPEEGAEMIVTADGEVIRNEVVVHDQPEPEPPAKVAQPEPKPAKSAPPAPDPASMPTYEVAEAIETALDALLANVPYGVVRRNEDKIDQARRALTELLEGVT